MPDAPIRGRCLCGVLRYEITGAILDFQYCHCSRCRKFTGSAHAANLFVRLEDFEWTAGAERRGTYTLSGQPDFPTAFCKECGSSMPSLSSTGKYWVVPAGGLEDDPSARPQRNIFWGSRAAWFEESSALPRHEELPDR